ncbi:MAG TPA: CRTAC1 family protein, partial [Polyangiaceae bacterium]|nr:CRTAC1 family protein [Polyangiaceae bacterium]
GTFTDVTTAAGIQNGGLSRGGTWGDYDNDGDLDLYVANLKHASPTSDNKLFSNDGDGTFTNVATAAGVTCLNAVGAGASTTFVDYNNDGHLDISITNGEGNATGPYLLFQNQGHAGHWLKVILQGVASERDGLGARLELASSVGTLHRVHDGPQHFLSQSLMPVHFGLGPSTIVDTLTVTWPSGTVQVLEDIPVDQQITVVEGEDGWNSGGAGGAGGAGGTSGTGDAGAAGETSTGQGGAGAMSGGGGDGQGGGGAVSSAGADQGAAGETSRGGSTARGGSGNDAGESSTGAGGETSNAGANDGTSSTDDGTCNCSVPGAPTSGGWFAALLFGVFGVARRRVRNRRR